MWRWTAIAFARQRTSWRGGKAGTHDSADIQLDGAQALVGPAAAW
jgi:hypothetical protein